MGIYIPRAVLLGPQQHSGANHRTNARAPPGPSVPVAFHEGLRKVLVLRILTRRFR